VNLPIADVAARLESLLAKIAPELDSEALLSAVLWTAMRADGRVDPVSDLLKDLDSWITRGRPLPTAVASGAAARTYDFGGAPGVLFLPMLAKEVVRLGATNGIVAVGLRNTGGVHSLSTWVRPIAESGMLGIFMWNGGSYTTVPFGGADPYFGTNPLAYAIPTSSEPLVADMATSEIPFMDLTRAIKNREVLPELAGLDSNGLPSTDPVAVYNENGDDTVRLRPLGGGHKGSAIMLLVEVLTGAVVGSKMGRAATDDPFVPEEFGGLLLAIDPQAFGTGGSFVADVDSLADDIRRSRPAPGVETVSIPGDRSTLRQERRMLAGVIEIRDSGIETLERLEKS
jgi:ureidoglycolate dehydrogenase (NAD+)